MSPPRNQRGNPAFALCKRLGLAQPVLPTRRCGVRCDTTDNETVPLRETETAAHFPSRWLENGTATETSTRARDMAQIGFKMTWRSLPVGPNANGPERPHTDAVHAALQLHETGHSRIAQHSLGPNGSSADLPDLPLQGRDLRCTCEGTR